MINYQPVPSPINLRNMVDARQWAAEANDKRPYRYDVMQVICNKLAELGVSDVIEIGSGPGFLAEQVLERLPAVRYTAYDFSEAMHTIARERLADTVNYIVGDFMDDGWEQALGKFNAVLALQCVHETRHKLAAPKLFQAIYNLLHDNAVFLYCDHFYEDTGGKAKELFMTETEQQQALINAGFEEVKQLLRIGTLSLWQAFRRH